MILKPASGTRDLHPKQVEINNLISNRLSEIYKLWGYEEVSPPKVERFPTLVAGGGIASEEIVQIVADEPLGLRPEMTASIARAASTRLANRPRPLRLWASGTVFGNKESAEGGYIIEESLQSGVELLGIKNITAEMELLSLLLKSLETLELRDQLKPKLLIGHTILTDVLLLNINEKLREEVKRSLVEFNRINLESIEIEKKEKRKLIKMLECRGKPKVVLDIIKTEYGQSKIVKNLSNLFNMIEPIAKKHKVQIQLDPTFLPHFDLYTGLVFQLVSNYQKSPIVIARGGRYDKLVETFAGKKKTSAGVGFSYAVDKVRELNSIKYAEAIERINYITYQTNVKIDKALELQRKLHSENKKAIVDFTPCENKQEAENRFKLNPYADLVWLGE